MVKIPEYSRQHTPQAVGAPLSVAPHVAGPDRGLGQLATVVGIGLKAAEMYVGTGLKAAETYVDVVAREKLAADRLVAAQASTELSLQFQEAAESFGRAYKHNPSEGLEAFMGFMRNHIEDVSEGMSPEMQSQFRAQSETLVRNQLGAQASRFAREQNQRASRAAEGTLEAAQRQMSHATNPRAFFEALGDLYSEKANLQQVFGGETGKKIRDAVSRAVPDAVHGVYSGGGLSEALSFVSALERDDLQLITRKEADEYRDSLNTRQKNASERITTETRNLLLENDLTLHNAIMDDNPGIVRGRVEHSRALLGNEIRRHTSEGNTRDAAIAQHELSQLNQLYNRYLEGSHNVKQDQLGNRTAVLDKISAVYAEARDGDGDLDPEILADGLNRVRLMARQLYLDNYLSSGDYQSILDSTRADFNEALRRQLGQKAGWWSRMLGNRSLGERVTEMGKTLPDLPTLPPEEQRLVRNAGYNVVFSLLDEVSRTEQREPNKIDMGAALDTGYKVMALEIARLQGFGVDLSEVERPQGRQRGPSTIDQAITAYSNLWDKLSTWE